MPPKKSSVSKVQKTRADSTASSSARFDRARFVNSEASRIFSNFLGTRTLLAERGIKIHDFCLRTSWRMLAANPEPAVVPIVREFYANAVLRDDSRAIVRGKEVDYSSARINTYFELENVANDAFQANRNLPLSVEEVTSLLVGGEIEAEWSYYSDGKPRHIKESFLDWNARGVHKFISARLMPSGHTSEVTWERAVLNYTIQKQERIDVGVIINDQISSAIKSGRNSAYCFPNLITELCRLSGVRWPQGLEILPAKPMITYKLVNTARAPVARGTSRGRGEQDDQAEEAEIVRDEGGPSGQNLASRVDAIERGFHSMQQDSLQFQGWVTTVLREMATHTGVAPERIPPWPPVHPDQTNRD